VCDGLEVLELSDRDDEAMSFDGLSTGTCTDLVARQPPQ
jgi:hypothetical protein